MGVIRPLSEAQIGALRIDERPCFMSPVDAESVFGVFVDNIFAFVKGQNLFTMMEYANLDAELDASLVDLSGALFVKLVSGVTKI